MNVTVETLAPCKRLIRVEVETEKVEAVFEEITRDFQREARMPGFRPGKAPKDVIVKRFAEDIQTEAKRKLMSDAYRKAVADEKLTVVTRPDVEEIQFGRGQAMQFAATVEIAPDFELPSYKGLPARRGPSAVTEADIAKALNMLAERQAKFETVAREVKAGDVAVVNYTGTCEGKPITEIAPTARGLAKQEHFWIHADPASFIPGFGPQLIGMKAGETRAVTVDFPADFVTPQLSGKKGVFETQVAEVKEKILPAMDDAFAKSYDAASLDALREGVRADLQNELNQKTAREIRQQVVDGLVRQINCDLPESVVEGETRAMVYRIVSEQQRHGASKEALDSQKDQIYGAASAAARERVKMTFALQKIAEKEGVRVEQLEIAQRLQAMAAQNKMPVEKLVKELEKLNRLGEIHEQLLQEKVIDILVQFAKVEDQAAGAGA